MQTQQSLPKSREWESLGLDPHIYLEVICQGLPTAANRHGVPGAANPEDLKTTRGLLTQ